MGFSEEEINAEVAQNIDRLVWIDQFLNCFIEVLLRWIMLSINYATNGVVFPRILWKSIRYAWNASFDAFPITVYLKLWMIYIHYTKTSRSQRGWDVSWNVKGEFQILAALDLCFGNSNNRESNSSRTHLRLLTVVVNESKTWILNLFWEISFILMEAMRRIVAV